MSNSEVSNGVSKGKEIESPEAGEGREKWDSKVQFLLSCVGLSVGIGNVWRFPYLAYQNGGGAFLLAYVIMLALVGKPHFFAELAIGQFSSSGAINMWNCVPIAKGIGVGMIIMSTAVCIYYMVIMSYTLYYILQSLRSDVPWRECQSWWGADKNCYVRQGNQTTCRDIPELFSTKYTNYTSTDVNVTNIYWKDKIITVPAEDYENALSSCLNGSQTASEQFWERYVLQLTSSIDEIGTVKWDLALVLFVCWVIVFFVLIKGIKSTGKVVYFTATFPYVILILLVIYGSSLPGAIEGFKYLFIPEWRKLLEIEVWRAAIEQLIFSMSIGSGCLVMFASYNKFDNRLYRDAMFVSTLDFLTSLMAGIVIFSVLGNMSQEMGIDISKVAKGGQGLAFVTYPEALARLPIPQLWSVLFFFMLFLLAIDSEFSFLENIFTALYDKYPHLKKRKTLITLFTCIACFLLGLPCVTQGGQYVLNLMDKYAGGYAGIYIATMEITAIMWIYGANRFAEDIEFMLGFKPSLYWRLCWRFISPTILWFVLIYSLSTHKIIDYAGQAYPLWAEAVGWILVLISVLPMPIYFVYYIYRFRNDFRNAFCPHPDWGPLDSEIRKQYFKTNASLSIHKKVPQEGVINIGMVMLPEEYTIPINGQESTTTNGERKS